MTQLPTVQAPGAAPPASAPAPKIDWDQLLTGDFLIRHMGRILLILLVAFIVYRLIKLTVRRLVRHEVDAEDPVVKRLRQQRAQTLGSLFQNVALVVITTLTGLTILDPFIAIGPLLAGVSVIGLAVSFGAQSLVKDIITGTFILLEGQFGIGDVVRIGDTSGSVEKLTLRTTLLRDGEGVLHIIPNGEIKQVSNLTKTWSRAVVDVSVDFREDADRVIALLRELGASFHSEPEWKPLLLDEPEVLGVERLSENAVVIRMQVKTLPLKQWDVARELRRRIKKRFDAGELDVPHPQVIFHWGDQPVTFPAAGEERSRRPATHKS